MLMELGYFEATNLLFMILLFASAAIVGKLSEPGYRPDRHSEDHRGI